MEFQRVINLGQLGVEIVQKFPEFHTVEMEQPGELALG